MVASAEEGVKFIGAGEAVGHLADMRPADVWMIATRDDAIVPSAQTLAKSAKVTPDDIVFHVSGATPSADLAPVKDGGALIASVHPIKTFTDAEIIDGVARARVSISTSPASRSGSKPRRITSTS